VWALCDKEGIKCEAEANRYNTSANLRARVQTWPHFYGPQREPTRLT
jgi:hypothetical protein